MKKLIFAVIAGLTLFQAAAGEVKWETDLAKAQAEAAKDHKLVMLLFTGSDWCPPCIKLEKDVFGSAEFATYAAKNLVCVKSEYLKKTKQPEAVVKAHQALATKYNLEGYPTVIVFNAAGKKVGQMVGYNGGGLKEITALVDEAKTK